MMDVMQVDCAPDMTPRTTVVTREYVGGIKIKIRDTRSCPHIDDLKLYFKQFYKTGGLLSLNAYYAFNWIAEPEEEVYLRLGEEIQNASLKKQIRFYMGFEKLIQKCTTDAVEGQEGCVWVDFKRLKPYEVFAMLYFVSPGALHDLMCPN